MIKIVFVLVLVILLVLIYAYSKPSAFQVQRSVQIGAAPDKVFAFINDFRQWDAWTPYNKDPAMTKTYRGADSGPGAGYDWSGTNAVGQGSIDIMQTTPPNLLVLDLQMLKPFPARNRVEFRLQAQGAGTDVTWYMEGRQAFMMKVMGLFMDMDKLVGQDFEVGLSRLKALAERAAG